MAQPVPAASICRALCRGWPLLAAALLTLLLGWSAWQEGRDSFGSAMGVQAMQGGAPLPAGKFPHHHALPAGEAEPESARGSKLPLPQHLCHLLYRSPAGSADVVPTEALYFHLPHPRQPPGHAPPLHA